MRGAHILQAVVDGRLYVQSMEPRVLRSDEQVPSRESAFPHCSPGFLLVAVHLSGIYQHAPVSGIAQLKALVQRTDMTESYGDSLLDLVYGTLPVAECPRAECDARDGVA